jgi:NAD+ synthase (glutamine-hydrolysing)
MGFKKATLGLSGGIDSALVLVLAVEALGKENVRVLLMPSRYSSDHSINDALQLAKNLDIQYEIIPIQEMVASFEESLSGVFTNLKSDVTEENIQARTRGILLMALSNKFGNILLNTTNKSECAVGYGTLYGDMNGGLSVLGDVYKTDIFRMANWINRDREIIPKNTILKPPSAELRPDQKDSDSLPDYDILDQILFNYIELNLSPAEIISKGFDESTVLRTVRMVNTNEYKRFQAPPILRISSKAFGFGRRMPLVAFYP